MGCDCCPRTHTLRGSDDRQQSSMTQKEQEGDETVSANAATSQKEDEAMTLDENMSEPRTEGETDVTVLSKQDDHNTEEGKKHDPTPLDSNLPTIPTTSHVATDAGVSKRDPNKQRREDRTYIQDAHRTHDEADLQITPPQESPKKSKEQRTDRDIPSSRERTRSCTPANPSTNLDAYSTSLPPILMSYIYKLATINFQGISSDTRIQMLNHFLHA